MSKRIFIAVAISEEARSLVAEYIDEMRGHARGVRIGWEKPEKLHVTLRFLGNVREELLDGFSSVMRIVAEQCGPFDIAVKGTGVFPNARRPRVLWLGVEDTSEALQKIAACLDTRLATMGIREESRIFKPHLTIARIREPQKAAILGKLHLQEEFRAREFVVNELVLYESKLGKNGSVYTPIATSPIPRTRMEDSYG